MATAPGHMALMSGFSAAFTAGDRWCAVGDSITHIELYTAYIHLFHVLRTPHTRFEFFNAGISGDTAVKTLARCREDILVHRPTVTTIMLGMNDVGRPLYLRGQGGAAVLGQRRQAIDDCLAHWRRLAQELRAAGSRLIFITPSPFDQTAVIPNGDVEMMAGESAVGANDGLAEIARGVKALASELAVPVFDFHGVMTRINREAQQKDPGFTLIGEDRIHPGPVGHMVMASLFLQAQGVRSEVSSLSLDKRTGRVLACRYGACSQVEADEDAIRFKFESESLPFPRLPEAAAAWSLSPALRAMNQETLAVTGLGTGQYRIECDGEPVAEVTGSALAAGINLAELPTSPQLRQAERVAELMRRRRELVDGRLRAIALVEHHYMEQADWTTCSPDTTYAFLRAAVEQEKEKPIWYDYLSQQIEIYRREKPRQAATTRELAEITEQMWREARPRRSRYVIHRIAPAEASTNHPEKTERSWK